MEPVAEFSPHAGTECSLPYALCPSPGLQPGHHPHSHNNPHHTQPRTTQPVTCSNCPAHGLYVTLDLVHVIYLPPACASVDPIPTANATQKPHVPISSQANYCQICPCPTCLLYPALTAWPPRPMPTTAKELSQLHTLYLFLSRVLVIQNMAHRQAWRERTTLPSLQS